jgi:hypothetical protein
VRHLTNSAPRHAPARNLPVLPHPTTTASLPRRFARMATAASASPAGHGAKTAARAPQPRPISATFSGSPPPRVRLRQAPRQPPPRRRDHRRQRQRDPRAARDRAARPAQDGRLQGDPQERHALLLRGDAGPRRAGGRPERRHRAALHLMEVRNSRF